MLGQQTLLCIVQVLEIRLRGRVRTRDSSGAAGTTSDAKKIQNETSTCHATAPWSTELKLKRRMQETKPGSAEIAAKQFSSVLAEVGRISVSTRPDDSPPLKYVDTQI